MNHPLTKYSEGVSLGMALPATVNDMPLLAQEITRQRLTFRPSTSFHKCVFSKAHTF